MFLAPNTSTFLQTTLAVDAHVAGGQFLHEERRCKVSDIPNWNSEINNFQNGRAKFQTRVHLSKKEGIKAMPHHMKSAQL
jgi:hypothetical protein